MSEASSRSRPQQLAMARRLLSYIGMQVHAHRKAVVVRISRREPTACPTLLQLMVGESMVQGWTTHACHARDWQQREAG